MKRPDENSDFNYVLSYYLQYLRKILSSPTYRVEEVASLVATFYEAGPILRGFAHYDKGKRIEAMSKYYTETLEDVEKSIVGLKKELESIGVEHFEQSMSLFGDSLVGLPIYEAVNQINYTNSPYLHRRVILNGGEDIVIGPETTVLSLRFNEYYDSDTAESKINIGKNVLVLRKYSIGNVIKDSNLRLKLVVNSKHLTPYDFRAIANCISDIVFNATPDNWYKVPWSNSLLPLMDKLNKLGLTGLTDIERFQSNGEVIEFGTEYTANDLIQFNNNIFTLRKPGGYRCITTEFLKRFEVYGTKEVTDRVKWVEKIDYALIKSMGTIEKGKREVPLFDGVKLICKLELDCDIDSPITNDTDIMELVIGSGCKNISNAFRDCTIFKITGPNAKSVKYGKCAFTYCRFPKK